MHRLCLFLILASVPAWLTAGESAGPANGTLLVDGGGTSDLVVKEFVRLSGGPNARIVVFPTGASSLRFGANLTSAKRETELVTVCDQNPGILGLGIDDDAALLVRGNQFQVLGTGRVAVYDDHQHSGAWYYWLTPGARFDLATWKKLP